MTEIRPDAIDQGPGSAARSPALAVTTSTKGTHHRWRGINGLIWALEHAQDAVTVAVGIVLILLAAILLISGVADFADRSHGPVYSAASSLLDHVLLVLILVEIVHTVVLSLRTHHLAAQPFIVVGLVAVIRRILFVLTPGAKVSASPSNLALLIAMVAVFIAGLIAVSRLAPDRED
ncbi:MAG TPA: phosphate-starvation-inducible PsiE family protein [Streptosporangiaceae bacterium]|jgi:uncharacterized membrane protein (DUF373 family)|nr:phosphate-starvation-inducible PsiE family protein [Streptosporangiaceae bacterium]